MKERWRIHDRANMFRCLGFMCNRTRVLAILVPFKKFIENNRLAWGIRWSRAHNKRLHRSSLGSHNRSRRMIMKDITHVNSVAMFATMVTLVMPFARLMRAIAIIMLRYQSRRFHKWRGARNHLTRREKNPKKNKWSPINRTRHILNMDNEASLSMVSIAIPMAVRRQSGCRKSHWWTVSARESKDLT